MERGRAQADVVRSRRVKILRPQTSVFTLLGSGGLNKQEAHPQYCFCRHSHTFKTIDKRYVVIFMPSQGASRGTASVANEGAQLHRESTKVLTWEFPRNTRQPSSRSSRSGMANDGDHDHRAEVHGSLFLSLIFSMEEGIIIVELYMYVRALA